MLYRARPRGRCPRRPAALAAARFSSHLTARGRNHTCARNDTRHHLWRSHMPAKLPSSRPPAFPAPTDTFVAVRSAPVAGALPVAVYALEGRFGAVWGHRTDHALEPD